MHAIDDMRAMLELEQTGPGQYRAQNLDLGHGVIFGGQLLAQTLVAGVAGHDDKRVKTVHTIFARGGKPDAPVEITVDPMHSGRAFASSSVTISQGDRLCTRSQVLLTAPEPDFIHHADPAPGLEPPPADWSNPGGGDWQVRVVDDVDINDPELVGPADLDVWSRFVGAPTDDLTTSQALLAFATDGFLIGTAMRPHAGVGQALAHRSISTGVISHTITFHEPFEAGQWLLLAHHSPFAGGGRCYGEANVFRADGALTASYVQDAMVRSMPDGSKM